MDIRDPFMRQTDLDLTISIVTYNSTDMICQCLASVYAETYAFSHEVIVVDNNSFDGTVSDVLARFPDIELIRNSRNLGYARAHNQAIRQARGRYVLVLNPDIVVMKGTISAMLAHMETHQRVGISGCRLIYPNGRLQFSCRRFPTLATFLLRGTGLGTLFPRIPLLKEFLLEEANHQQNFLVDWCLGSCLLLRREALEEVGGLDGNYFLYYEDIDLCYRMKQKNWEVAFVGEAEMIHHYRRMSASVIPNRFTLHHIRSALYFFRKFAKERGQDTLW